MMNNEGLYYWDKVRQLCCDSWGIPPWEFDFAWSSGKIRISHVERVLELAEIKVPEPLRLIEWLRPGLIDMVKEEARAEAEEQQYVDSWDALMQVAKKPKVNL